MFMFVLWCLTFGGTVCLNVQLGDKVLMVSNYNIKVSHLFHCSVILTHSPSIVTRLEHLEYSTEMQKWKGSSGMCAVAWYSLLAGRKLCCTLKVPTWDKDISVLNRTALQGDEWGNLMLKWRLITYCLWPRELYLLNSLGTKDSV